VSATVDADAFRAWLMTHPRGVCRQDLAYDVSRDKTWPSGAWVDPVAHVRARCGCDGAIATARRAVASYRRAGGK